MALELTYLTLKREVARSVGLDRDPDNWSADELLDITDSIDSGLRMFYLPFSGYNWSFLAPESQMTIPADTEAVELPADFLSLVSPFRTGKGKLRVVSESDISTIQKTSDQSGQFPEYCSLRMKDGAERYEVLFHPKPASEVVVSYRYQRAPKEITGDSSVLDGGVLHHETIIAACVLAIDVRLNQEVPNSLLNERFTAMLSAAIETDKSLYQGED